MPQTRTQQLREATDSACENAKARKRRTHLIIADDDLGFTQAIIAQRQGCAQSTVSQVLAAERLRRLRAELGRDADGSDGSETSVRALHAAEQVREALAYVRAVEKRLRAVQRLLVADAAADNNDR